MEIPWQKFRAVRSYDRAGGKHTIHPYYSAKSVNPRCVIDPCAPTLSPVAVTDRQYTERIMIVAMIAICTKS